MYFALFIVFGVSGALIVVVGRLCAKGEVTRDYWPGVRTLATLESDAAFRIANAVAGPWIEAAGWVFAATGVAALVLWFADLPYWTLATLTLVSISAGLALVGWGSLRGVRAARDLTAIR
ncbi:MAG: SdpI family protein [Bifidobacteriaceae bacterium]|jgi:hypothetical protein|nr:SdpI family protein [Bifidobacteriaceae bacterium]